MSRWLEGRRCSKCGSSMVTWRFEEPHCFCCGSNVPFSEPIEEKDFVIDNVFRSEGVMESRIEDDIRSLGVIEDKMVELARILSRKK